MSPASRIQALSNAFDIGESGFCPNIVSMIYLKSALADMARVTLGAIPRKENAQIG